MTAIKIGYARVSTHGQDFTAQRQALADLGVEPDRVYVDHGISGTHRARPGLREALTACRPGDTLVVTKLDRLARSVPDARDIVHELNARSVSLNLGGSVHDPADPIGRLLFTVLSMIAEFEVDLAGRAPARAWRSPRPRAGCAASNPNSTPSARLSWSRCGGPATTPPSSSPRCSTSPAPPCTGPSNEPALRPAARRCACSPVAEPVRPLHARRCSLARSESQSCR